MSANEPVERPVGQLAARPEQLLGDERQAARPFGDEHERGRGRPLPLDRLDELAQLGPLERRDRDPGRGRDPARRTSRPPCA